MPTRKTILVMDEDPDLLQVLRQFLEWSGYRVLLASDGREGLALAHTAEPDLVLLDMLMPGLNGFAVLERFRADEAEVPVVMLGHNDSQQHRAYAEFLGADDFLRKPFPLGQLLEMVRRFCPAAEPVGAC